MDPEMNNWLQMLFRWAHIVAGILWIGHLYFFNFVNAHFAKALTADSKRGVVPELMPRALYWFRWGAAWTWITGILLLALIYYHGRIVFEEPNSGNPGLWFLIVLVNLAVGFVVYNLIMKSIANKTVASAICLALMAAGYLFFEYIGQFSGRSLYIHAGGTFGTIMAANVWMVIWPAQRKIIAATKEGTAPDANLVALAGLRSRHNTYMSVPLIFTMISNHYPTVYGSEYRDLYLALIIAVGFIVTSLLYKKSAKVAGF